MSSVYLDFSNFINKIIHISTLRKPGHLTIYINIYLYIFIMFMLCIYAHGTKSRKVHGQSIGQRNFLRVWLCIYNMKEFDRNLYRVIFGAKFEFWENPWNFRFFFLGNSSDFPRNVSGMSTDSPRTNKRTVQSNKKIDQGFSSV